MPVFILFPILAVQFMYRRFKDLNEPKMKALYGELYEGFSTKNRWVLFYWFIDYVRKFLLAFCVVITQE